MTSLVGLGGDKRRHARFPSMCRAKYLANGQWTITSAVNLSRGGVLLAGGAELPVGEEIGLSLCPDADDRPIVVEGRVLIADDLGTRIAFLPGQPVAESGIQQLIQQQAISILEYELGGADDTAALRQVTSWYREVGRLDDALALYRSAAEVGEHGVDFYCDMAAFLLETAQECGPSAEDLLVEAVEVIDRGLSLESSGTLESMRAEANKLLETSRDPARSRQEELERLKKTIQRDREALYDGFSRLLQDHNRLDELEAAVGEPAPDQRSTTGHRERMEGLLRTIQSRLEDLRGPHVATRSGTPEFDGSPPDGTGKSARFKLEDVRPTRGGILAKRLALVAMTLVLVGGLVWVSGQASSRLLGDPNQALEETTPDLPPEIRTAPRAGHKKKRALSRRKISKAKRRALKSEGARRNRSRETAGSVSGKQPGASPRAQPVAPAEASLADAYLAAGERYLQQRKPILAQHALEKCVALRPRDAEAFRLLGVAHAMVGREQSAIASFEAFLRLAPDHKAAGKVRELVESHRKKPRPK
ncbi:tetratricopeptide repeat protein [Myxococcota bacterium]